MSPHLMGRILLGIVSALLLLPMASQAISYQFEAAEGTAWINCDEGYIELSSNNTSIANGSDYSVELDAGNITITTPYGSRCQTVLPVNEEMPNLRPGPSEDFHTFDLPLCLQTYATCNGEYFSGNLENDSADVFAINVSADEVLNFLLMASSSDLEVNFHFQNNSSETDLAYQLTTTVNTSYGDRIELLIPIHEDGRLLITVTSQSPSTLWAIHNGRLSLSPVGLTDFDQIQAFGKVPKIAAINGAQSIVILRSSTYGEQGIVPVQYRYMLESGEFSEPINATQGDRIRGMDGAFAIEITWQCDCHWSASLELDFHYDAGMALDAPSLRPSTAQSDNSTYPKIELDGSLHIGELTVGNHDYSDVLLYEVTGWNDSIHLINVDIDGGIYDLKLTLYEMDQYSWEVIKETSATYSMTSVSASIEVGPGTHFILIEHINGSAALTPDADSVAWRMIITTAVIEEGEEPWFQTSQAVKDAAQMFYWIIGFLLGVPFLLFVIHIKREERFAKEFALKKNRLDWLRQRIDAGKPVEKDLNRALRAISSLEWEEALGAWGVPEIRHNNGGIDLAVWRLDSRLAKNGNWPLLIGVYPQERDWNVAGIRFEAPQGGQWNVAKVEPKLLYRNHEIFLDTLKKGSRFFFQIQLEGNAPALDLLISGMVEGEPMAAKPSRTIYRELGSSEE